ncbi:sugar ABC transporter ATP-binding protein [Streptosporangium sp. KLBMP 9127]|nr:sugar ABC transporter ATP-binding protein [Streptosporangium sp. KLBMP 9127]
MNAHALSRHSPDSAHPVPPDGARAAVAVHGLVKRYPGVQALDGVDLSLAAGEVRALLGKNGAGKSTLVKILSGAVRPDAGRIHIGGRQVELPSPAVAREQGIATVHQELSLVPELSVAENILLGRWRAAGTRGGLINPAALVRYASRFLDDLRLELDPRAKVGELSVAEQQMVEIARALSYGGKVLILDEPTSSLPAAEVDTLLVLVRRLAETGLAVIYVSHRMDEIPRVADSITVLRDGSHVATRPVGDVTTAEIVEMMTGRTASPSRGPKRKASERVVLSVSGLSSGDRVRDVSFDLRQGEILGIVGLLGSGRTELFRCLYGLSRRESGSVELDGQPLRPRTPRQAIDAGLGFAPEDRKKEGLALGMGVSVNVTLSSPRRISVAGLLSRRKEQRVAEATRSRLAIKTPALRTAVGTLSGGNQQKVVLGKCLNARARVLLLNEPTRGVDVEAKEHIYALLRDLADEGSGIVVVSSEIEELFLVCDRLLVLNSGRVVLDRETGETDLPAVMAAAMEGSAR